MTSCVPKRDNNSLWWAKNMRTWVDMGMAVLRAGMQGYSTGNGMRDHLQRNLEYAKTDPIPHSFSFGEAVAVDKEIDKVSGCGPL